MKPPEISIALRRLERSKVKLAEEYDALLALRSEVVKAEFALIKQQVRNIEAVVNDEEVGGVPSPIKTIRSTLS
jgi:hypothetical protein